MAVVEFTWGEVEAPNVQAGFVRGYMGHNSRAEPFYLAERHYRWSNSGERAQVAQSAALGKVLLLSWKPEFRGETWTSTAAGNGDAALAACLADLLTITEGAREVHICMHHEPDTPEDEDQGTPEEFRAAHRRFVDKVVRPLAAASDFPVRSAICLLTSGYLPSQITKWDPDVDIGSGGGPLTLDEYPPQVTPDYRHTDWTSAADQQLGRTSRPLQVGDWVYVPGNYNRVRDSAAGSTEYTRTNLTRYDAETGELDTAWQPDPDGRCWSLCESADGAYLFVTGEFSTIGGETRDGIAAIDLSDGSIDPDYFDGFTVGPSGTQADGTPNAVIYDCCLDNAGRLVVGGTFTTIGAQSRERLAKLNVETSSVSVGSAFLASAANRLSRVLFDSANSRVIAVMRSDGLFNGTGAESKVAAFDSDGAVIWRANPRPAATAFDAALDGSKVYTAVGGSGGRVYANNLPGGAEQWFFHCDGDCQAVAIYKGSIFVGHHGDACASARDQTTTPQVSRGIFVLDAAGALQTWRPKFIRDTSATGGVLKVFAISAGPGRVFFGGDFTAVADPAGGAGDTPRVLRRRLAQFEDDAAPARSVDVYAADPYNRGIVQSSGKWKSLEQRTTIEYGDSGFRDFVRAKSAAYPGVRGSIWETGCPEQLPGGWPDADGVTTHQTKPEWLHEAHTYAQRERWIGLTGFDGTGSFTWVWNSSAEVEAKLEEMAERAYWKTGIGGNPLLPRTLLESGSSTTIEDSHATAEISPAAHELIVVTVVTSDEDPPVVPTLTNGGTLSLDWVQIGNAITTAGTLRRRITRWRALNAAPGTGAITIGAVGAQSYDWAIVSYAGVNATGINGENAVTNVVVEEPDVSEALATIGFAPFGSPLNTLDAAFTMNGSDGFTAPAGWDLLYNLKHNDPTTTLGIIAQSPPTDDEVTIRVTGGATRRIAAVAFEVVCTVDNDPGEPNPDARAVVFTWTEVEVPDAPQTVGLQRAVETDTAAEALTGQNVLLDRAVESDSAAAVDGTVIEGARSAVFTWTEVEVPNAPGLVAIERAVETDVAADGLGEADPVLPECGDTPESARIVEHSRSEFPADD